MNRKILQINVVANSGSTGHIAEGIAEVMIDKGWTCYTAYGRWANPSKTILYKIDKKHEIYIHYCESRLLGRNGLASKNATKRLIHIIRKINPDLIQLHNIHGYYINYPILFQYLRTLNIPIVWTLHDCWAFTGHCVHYTAVNCRKWMTLCSHCTNLNTYPFSLIDRSKKNYETKKKYFTSLHNLTIVTVSQWLENEVKHSFLSEFPVRVIQNGIDTDVFRPINSDIKSRYKIENKFLILGVATQWDERKGLNDFFKLAELLSHDEVIILVGLNKRQMHQLPSNIIGIPKTENVLELVHLYAGADIFVNCSVEETFGLTTIESMACGTPVIVYNSTACPEIVTEKTGFVIQPHNISAINNVVQFIKKTGKNRYIEPCSSYVKANFNKKDKFSEYAKLYDKLLSDN